MTGESSVRSSVGTTDRFVLSGRRMIRAASGGKDQRVRVWDLGEPNLAVAGIQIPTGPVSALCVCPDGWIVSGGTDKKLWLHEPSHVAEPIVLGRHDCAVTSCHCLARHARGELRR